jgi:hypothetical protein
MAREINSEKKDQESDRINVDPENMTQTVIENMKVQASQDVNDVLQELEKTHSGITEGFATALGAGTGAAGSLAALSSLGTVSGLSAAGVTTGLTAAGAILGGGMLVGLGVLATPVAAFGVFSYRMAKRAKKANKAVAVGLAAKKLCEIQSRLIQHKEHFKEELLHIKTSLEILTSMKTA